MLIALIRDMMFGLDEKRLAAGIEEGYLFGLDIKTEEDTPKLQLNTKDHEFYQSHILARPGDPKRKAKIEKSPRSNLRVREAASVIRKYFEEATKAMTAAARKGYLKDWLSYLDESAKLIVLTVPDDVNAYVMFETLNDRGLRVSQADLVKNYLFGQSGSRLSEAQAKWASMIRALETVDKEDTAIDYLRLISTLINGLTRERQVFERIKPLTSSPVKAVTFLDTIEAFSGDYVAMLTPEHYKWEDYPQSIRQSVSTLNLLGVTQIRHLMLAVAHHFNKEETAKSFRLFVDWIVRMFIAGSGRIGRVENVYATLAHQINSKIEIRTAKTLAERMAPNIASDREFEEAFARAYVSKTKLARYYLAKLEGAASGKGSPELIPNTDTAAVNLEHVLPIHATNVDAQRSEEYQDYTSRLGNLVLLNAGANSTIGNDTFEAKRSVFASSPFALTKNVATYEKWGISEIDDRQAKLAKLAVKTWPARVS